MLLGKDELQDVFRNIDLYKKKLEEIEEKIIEMEGRLNGAATRGQPEKWTKASRRDQKSR